MAKSIPVKANDSIIYHIELVHDFQCSLRFCRNLATGTVRKSAL